MIKYFNGIANLSTDIQEKKKKAGGGSDFILPACVSEDSIYHGGQMSVKEL